MPSFPIFDSRYGCLTRVILEWSFRLHLFSPASIFTWIIDLAEPKTRRESSKNGHCKAIMKAVYRSQLIERSTT